MSKEKPKSLEETRIWERYVELTKDTSYYDRINRVRKIYERSRVLLTAVSKTFPNYTLHNETHIVNVLNAMSGILGNTIGKLSIQELEVLIIVASLHDVGMTYTDDQEKEAYSNSTQIERFLKERYPGEYELNPDNWVDNMKQDYLRYLHPFRVEEIINNAEWKDIFDSWPHDMVGINTIVEICKAHGMTLDEIKGNDRLVYSDAKRADALFCAMLLRLADLLDFDDTRAPSVLFNYAKDNKISRQEFEKHMASGGFTYPDTPSEKALPYYATCPSPNVEHTINIFLNWIDEELQNCYFMQDQFKPQWKKDLVFPRKVSREEIDTEDFLGGEYCLELNYDQIMNLLSGEELYSEKEVFVRELLQNAIDATLLRAKMDSGFCIEEAPIEMWEWTDSEGWWFRIDDNGTGMTLGMLKKYFLSVGSSYYSSKEFKRDLSQYNFQNRSEYTGISKFGIGFLSCFLCGSFAEISTLHFDENKCCKDYKNINKTTKYGIRLEMGQDERFYTIRCQANNNRCPTPLPCDKKDNYGSYYRNKCGTSIVIKLDTTKIGEDIDLKESAEEFLYGTQIPVYFNGERIGITRAELLGKYRELSNYTETRNLSESEKKEFDEAFPELKGKYPSIEKGHYIFDSKKEIGIDGFTEIIDTISVNFDVEEDIYIRGVPCRLCFKDKSDRCSFEWEIKDINEYYFGDTFFSRFAHRHYYLKDLYRLLGIKTEEEETRITAFFDSFDECPSISDLGEFSELFPNEKALGYAWRIYLLSTTLDNVWGYKYDQYYDRQVSISYKGIVQDKTRIDGDFVSIKGVILLDDEWRPTTNVARSEIIHLPLEVNLLIDYLRLDIKELSFIFSMYSRRDDDRPIDMYDWREVMRSPTGVWLINQMKKHLHPNSELCKSEFCSESIIRSFVDAYCLSNYSMKVSYKDNETKISAEKMCNNDFGIIPPVLFCKASDEYTKNYIFGSNVYRHEVNTDHFFVKWFLENAAILRKHFSSSYFDILKAMKTHNSSLLRYSYHLATEIDKYGYLYGISSEIPKKLSSNDIVDYSKWNNDKYFDYSRYQEMFN